MQLRFLYFNFPFWRAEPSRLALHLGDIPFEDRRLGRDEFLEMKANGDFPFGQVPVLDVDGERIAQSHGIARFCGKLAGLYPANDALVAMRIDELMGVAEQIAGTLSPSMREKDPDKRLALRAELGSTTLPHWLELLEQRLHANDGSDFFVGSEMTMADLIIWRLLGWLSGGILDGIPTTLLEPFPLLAAHQSKIGDQPKIQAWMHKHYGSS